jgi:hypothetical protein
MADCIFAVLQDSELRSGKLHVVPLDGDLVRGMYPLGWEFRVCGRCVTV